MNRKTAIEDAIRKVNRRIAEIRVNKGLTQAKLADLMNVGVRDLQKWETDAGMNLRTIFRLTAVLGCNPMEFFQEPKSNQNGRGRPKKNLAPKLITCGSNNLRPWKH